MKILVFLSFLIVLGIAAAVEEERVNETIAYETEAAETDLGYLLETNFSLEFDQNVKGNGFFASYIHAVMPDPYGNKYGVVGEGLSGMGVQHRSHGSGTIDEQYKVSGYTYYTEAGVVPVEGGIELEPVIDDDEIYSIPFIQAKEDADIKYSPTMMAPGTGHYLNHPINFNSLLRDSNCIKNLDTGNLMQNDINYAHAIQKELEASADWMDQANTTMKFDEMITEGQTQIYVLKPADIPNFNQDEESAVPFIIKKSKPDIEIDEMYIGTFDIMENMSLGYWEFISDLDDEGVENWIPCCIDGWNTLPSLYQLQIGKDTRGIFDCTCYKAPKLALFPRVYG
ncbi:MAG: hypothetical protein MUO26_11575 [Methanotrichaceae archaeon]|nr:hypothetical protein [Methanotrichaceae archaeon]